MTAWLITAALAGGWLIAYLRPGSGRRAGIVLMVASTAAALGSLRGWSALLWAAGPLAATLFPRHAAWRRLDFEPLMGRTAIAASAAAVAVIAAVRLPSHGVAWQLELPGWLLLSTGMAWLMRPTDAQESAHGSALAIAGGGALLAGILPATGLTLFLGGLMALVPWLSERDPKEGVTRVRAPIYAGLAGLTLVASLLNVPTLFQTQGLGLRPEGTGWAATALLLASSAAMAEEAALPCVVSGAVALIALHPALAWPALAAALSGRRPVSRSRAIFSGAGLMALGLYAHSVLGGAVAQRWQLVLMLSGWLCVLIGPAIAEMETVPLLALSGFALIQITPLAAALPGRVAWLAFAAASLVLIWAYRHGRPGWLQTAGTYALALVSALSGTGLGAGAAMLLFLGLVLVGAHPAGPSRRLETFLRSSWPSTSAFAGRVLAAIAAVAASPALGALAVLLVALLTLFPAGPRPRGTRKSPVRRLALSALSIGIGLAPAVVLHLVQLFP